MSPIRANSSTAALPIAPRSLARRRSRPRSPQWARIASALRRKPPTSFITSWWCSTRAGSRSRRWRRCWPSGPGSPAWMKRLRARAAERALGTFDGTTHRRRPLALSNFSARRMGGAARRHADDPDPDRGRGTALTQRPPRHERGRGNLPAAVAAALALRGDHATTVSRPAELPWHRGYETSLHHRSGRLGGSRQVDHGARAQGAAGALAERAACGPPHYRRLPLSKRRARTRRVDGEEGLSRELRPAGAAALPHRRQSR